MDALLIKEDIEDNTKKESDNDKYMKEYVRLTIQYNKAQKEYSNIMKEQVAKDRRSIILGAFIEELRNTSADLEFNDRLFNLTVKSMKINNDKPCLITFKDESTISISFNEDK